MRMLRWGSFVAALAVVSVAFYHFFIQEVGTTFIFSLNAVMFMLLGVEQVWDRMGRKKVGYTYIFVSLISLLVVAVNV
ncbi:hypothetical protein EQV77_06535 [Halobacillus fulvus]|nr:hypothetical protein EQV77_06535 [Halobacillus fulvus]